MKFSIRISGRKIKTRIPTAPGSKRMESKVVGERRDKVGRKRKHRGKEEA